MKIFKKIFKTDVIKVAEDALDEARVTLDCEALPIVKAEIDKVLRQHPDVLKKQFDNGLSPRQWAYTAIVNVSGDLLESGEFHLYRGVLDPIKHGSSLLTLYDSAMDELIKMGAITPDSASTEKKALRENLASVG